MMDKEQIIEWLSDNLKLESRTIHDSLGNPMGVEIEIGILDNNEKHSLAQTQIYFD